MTTAPAHTPEPRSPSLRHGSLLIAGVLALGAAACSGDDGGGDAGPADAGIDGGDTTPADSGVDAGFRDIGFRDTGPRPDAGHYCVMNGEVDVDGTGVPVDDPEAPPVSSTGGPAILSCIDDPPSDNPPFINELCFTECVDFMGANPSMAEVMDLEVAIFSQEVNDTPVDPSYDFMTGADRQPTADTGAGARFMPNAADCPSGWQVEIGYGNLGTVLTSETRFIVRVRSVAQAPTFATSYLYNFIRRNDEVPQVSVCGNDEQRIPGRTYTFPVVPASLMASAVGAATGDVVGAGDLFDGLGSGHAIVETRDCSAGGGTTSRGMAVGFAPAPAGASYLDGDYTIDGAATETNDNGLAVAVGFPGNTATSSMTVDVVAAVGATTDGTCTEEFGGRTIPVFSDSVTLLRMNRETVIHGR